VAGAATTPRPPNGHSTTTKGHPTAIPQPPRDKKEHAHAHQSPGVSPVLITSKALGFIGFKTADRVLLLRLAAPWRCASRAASRRRALLPLAPLTGNAGRTYRITPPRDVAYACLWRISHLIKNKNKPRHNSCTRQLVLGTHGPAAAHGTGGSLFKLGTRGPPYCCSRHTVYSYLGLAVLLLLTAYSLCTLGTHGPAKHHLCYSKRYFYSHSKPIVGLYFPSGRRTRAALAHSHLCTLFLEHLCTP
jgi:hypothetical protein